MPLGTSCHFGPMQPATEVYKPPPNPSTTFFWCTQALTCTQSSSFLGTVAVPPPACAHGRARIPACGRGGLTPMRHLACSLWQRGSGLLMDAVWLQPTRGHAAVARPLSLAWMHWPSLSHWPSRANPTRPDPHRKVSDPY